jgi:hypothetical protein
MALTVEELAKLVYKHHGGSKQLISAHPDKLTADQKVVCSNHAGCICLGDRRLQYEILLKTGSYKGRILAHFLAIFGDPLLAITPPFAGCHLRLGSAVSATPHARRKKMETVLS